MKFLERGFCIVVFTLFWPLEESASAAANIESQDDPCCQFPCKNGGVCMRTLASKDGFICDCTGIDFHGEQCETPFLLKRLTSWIRPTPEAVQYMLTHYSWLWVIVNNITPLRRFVMKYIYLSRSGNVDSPPRFTSGHNYVTLEAYYNHSYYALTLPPVPQHCPTIMDAAGMKDIPNADALVRQLFLRRRFIPDPYGTNVLFAGYAQHFSHQFFKTDSSKGPGFTLGGDGVDATHIYGKDVATQNKLRSFQDGKLKTQVIDGEEYPPQLSDAAVENDYPSHIPEHLKFAIGHPFYGFLPGLFVFATIWLREHNRVCDLLKMEHGAAWDDERIFQTTRLIIIGETIKITIEEYVQHLSQYKLRLTFEPELTHRTEFQYSNRIRVEFNHLYHWHALVPDHLDVAGTLYELSDVYFNVSSVFKHGFAPYVDSMVRQQAGKLSRRNHSPALLYVLSDAIVHGRTLRLQPFNKYRERFGMKPYMTFQDLTGEKEISLELERMYGSIDAVEFIVGMLVERDGYGVTPMTMVEIGGPYSIKGLLSNPICSPPYWKPSTFGGEIGFQRVKTATLERLFCENISKGPCPRISFTVAQQLQKEESGIKSNEEL